MRPLLIAFFILFGYYVGCFAQNGAANEHNITDYYSSATESYRNGIFGLGQVAGQYFTTVISEGLQISFDADNDPGEYLMTGHNNVQNSIVNIQRNSSIYNSGAQAAWGREWYFEKTGNFDAQIAFDLNKAFEYGNNPLHADNYVLLYRSNTNSNYAIPTVTSKGISDSNKLFFIIPNNGLNNGYYTLATLNENLSPLQGTSGTTWYSFKSGNWSDWQNWTLDPSGAQLNNDNRYTPSTSPTSLADKIIILSGKTISVEAGNDSLKNAELTINGRLNFNVSHSHFFNKITGSGRIVLAGDNFPAGDASHFISKGLGEGTVVYKGYGYGLKSNGEFYNIEIECNDQNDTIEILTDLKINGNLEVINGAFQIGNETQINDLQISVDGNVLITEQGKILTGTSNTAHTLTLKGDLKNEGLVKLTNRIEADYDNDATNGYVTLLANSDNNDQHIQCDGPSIFYRIIIDKGNDKTYILNIEAAELVFFSLFGPANHILPNNAELINNDNALSLIRGTVKIGRNINIPILSNNSIYNIPENARLWVDGGYVGKSQGNALVIYGTVQVSDGTIDINTAGGISLKNNGILHVEGGTVIANQIRTSSLSTGNQGGFMQNGGEVNLLGQNINDDYYIFNLTYPGNVFKMKGGTLNINATGLQGGIFINSTPGNIQVTGGTINFNITDNNDFIITSNAPFWNLNLINATGNSNKFLLSDGKGIGPTNENLPAQDLVVLNDFTIAPNTWFKTNGLDVYIGRNFTINDGAIYDYDSNTTVFDGPLDASLYIGDITEISPTTIGYSDLEGQNPYLHWEQPFGNFTINKSNNAQLTFASKDPLAQLSNAYKTNDGGKNIEGQNNNLVKVNGAFTLENGSLDVDIYSIRLLGNITNKGVLTTDYEPLNAMVKIGSASTNSAIDITTVKGSRFGNLQLNAAENIVRFKTDVVINRIDYQHGRINIGGNNLKVDVLDINLDSSVVTTNNFSVENMIITNGSPTDGGLSLYIPANGIDPSDNDSIFIFPLGIGIDGRDVNNGGYSKYTPATLAVQSISVDGYITINPVDVLLSSTSISGGDMLSYYWHVDTIGFSSTPLVDIALKYYDEDLDGSNNESSFVPGSVLNEGSYQRAYINNAIQVNENTNTITINSNAEGMGLGHVNYTAGMHDRFIGAPTIYYSRTDGDAAHNLNWHNGNDWSLISHTGPTAGAYPSEGDIAIIGYGLTDRNSYHRVHVYDGAPEVNIAKLIIDYYDQGYMWESRLMLHSNTSFNASSIEGSGTVAMFLRSSQVPSLNADMTAFNKYEQNRIHFYLEENGITHLPSNIVEYPNIRIEGWGTTLGERIVVADTNILVNYDVLIDGNAVLRMSSGLTGDIDIHGGLKLGSWGDGAIEFNGTGHTRKLTVHRNFTSSYANNYVTVQNSSPSGLEHEFNIGGNIQLDNGSFNLNNEGVNANNATLTLIDNGNSVFYRRNGPIPELYRIKVNKEEDAHIQIITDFNLSGSTDNDTKALQMISGTLILDNDDIDINLTTGGNDFKIPAQSGIEIRQGTLRVSGNDAGIYLDGSIHINGGTLSMDDTEGNGNNYIEYSASGNAELRITEGSLIVGSQIRRGLSSDYATLRYYQSGGVVEIGKNAAPENNRGVFEISGDNSAFYHTGGSLDIVRQQDTPTIASIYLKPEFSSLANGTVITIGNENTIADQTIGLYSKIPLQRIVVNDNGSAPTLQLWQVPLTISEELSIENNTEFDANGQDLILLGDFTNNGTFNANKNTTYWNGTSSQNIRGETEFYNISINSTDSVSTNNNLLVTNSLNIAQDAVFIDNSNTVRVHGYINMNGKHIHGGLGHGIIMDGSTTQHLTGLGTFGKLTISNPADVYIPLGNEFTITDYLSLEEGVFRIGKNLLTLNSDAEVEAVNPFSNTNMIETNISFTDKGVRKIFSTTTSSFLFPIGSNDKYTPVGFNISANGNNIGSITIKAADEMHPSIVNDEDVPAIIDANNALQYYWVVNANGMNNFNATANFMFDSKDLVVDTGNYSSEDYIPARILHNAVGTWNKYTDVNLNHINHSVPFTFIHTGDDGISGDYTAGITNAIPNRVQDFSTVNSGNWSESGTWNPTIAGGPSGAIANILPEHNISIDKNYILNYSTHIDGIVELGMFFGHRFGIITGTGRMISENGILPAGIYDGFFSSEGGTIEFTGTEDYDILAGQTEVNNLEFTANGERRLPNNIMKINGDFIINGTTVKVINEFDQALTIGGNMTLSSGSFDAGKGDNASIILSGNTTQHITGNFSESNSFNILEINNEQGVEIHNNIQIDHTLKLSDGIIISGAKNVHLSKDACIFPVAGKSASFVDGNLQKTMLAGDNFNFAIGNDNEQGTIQLNNVSGYIGYQEFTARYFFSDPNFESLNTSAFESPIRVVSNTEYWSIEGVPSARADIRITLDGSSDIANSTSLNELRMTGWNGSSWIIVGETPSISGTANHGTITINNVPFDGSVQFFTLASIENINDATIQITSSDQEICMGDSAVLTFILAGEPPYSFSFTDNTNNISTIRNVSSSVYSINVAPKSQVTYTLVSINDFSGPGFVLGGATTISVHDSSVTPSRINITQNNTCQGTTKTLTPNGGSLGYNASWVWYNSTNTTQEHVIQIGNTLTVDPVSDTQYWLRAEGACNNTSLVSATVTVMGASIAPSEIIKSADNISAGTSVTLSFSNGILGDGSKWYWFDSDPISALPIDSIASITVTPLETTTYYLQARGGCSPSGIVSTTITVNPLPLQPSVPVGANAACAGNTGATYTTQGAENANVYIWALSPEEAGSISGNGTIGTINWNPGYQGNAIITVQGENISGTGPISTECNVTIYTRPSVGVLYHKNN
ncbi:hypothetical protein OAO55_00775 [Bacteroidales bacterium]|nr:hypothetical protein [Bacteroidales bacterium]